MRELYVADQWWCVEETVEYPRSGAPMVVTLRGSIPPVADWTVYRVVIDDEGQLYHGRFMGGHVIGHEATFKFTLEAL